MQRQESYSRKKEKLWKWKRKLNENFKKTHLYYYSVFSDLKNKNTFRQKQKIFLQLMAFMVRKD